MKKQIWKRSSKFLNSVENGDFWLNSKGGTTEKFSKMADFLDKLRKAKK